MEPAPPPNPDANPPSPPPDLSPQQIAAVREDPSAGRLMLAGLSPEDIAQIRQANVRAKKIRRAISVARTDAGITTFFAIACLLLLCAGWENPVMGVLLGIIAWNAFRAAKKLQRFDRSAPRLLAMNQVYLAGIIIVYAVFELIVHLTHSATSSDLMSSGLSAQDIKTALGMDPAALDHLLAWTVYGLLIVGTVLFQGLTALYYKSRSKVLEEYLQSTPQWIVDFQAAQG